jgi:thioesterase domain-containing protein
MKQKSIDDTYYFGCTCCGDCCTGDMKIHINLYDLYKITRRLSLGDSGELFRMGLVKLVKGQNDAYIPRINFRTKPFKFCPWVINDMGEDDVLRGFCSLHPHDKPLVCKMAPVGRMLDLSDKIESFVLTEPTENCPGMAVDQENHLSDLKEEFREELDYETRFFVLLEKLEGSSEAAYERLYDLKSSIPFEEQLKEKELQSFIHENIPLAEKAGFTIDTASSEKVILQGPYHLNHNHHGTVFGGSISVIAVLTGWILVREIAETLSPGADIVISRQNLEYLQPLSGDFTAESVVPHKSELESFSRYLREKGRARMKVTVHVCLKGENSPAAVFEGTFHVRSL